MTALRSALLAAALAAAFAGGVLAGRRAGPPAPPASRAPAFAAYEIREGRSGFLNPLLECEVHDPQLETETRPFGAALDELARGIEAKRLVSRIAVYYRDLDNGPWVGHREREGFFPASLAKVPVVLACLRRAERDPGFLERGIVNRGLAGERQPGFANPEANLEEGRSYTVRELILRVARYSDNAAALLLARAVGGRPLADVYADLGLAGGDGADARMSPKEYAALFRILYNASYLDRENSARALEWFASSTFELGLVAGVPADVVVSHKFGVWEGREGAAEPLQLHDCGIVYHPTSPYLLCVMTGGDSYVRMASAIAEVSRFVYRQVDGGALRARPGR